MTMFPAGAIQRNGVIVPIFVDDVGRWHATVDTVGNGEGQSEFGAGSRADLDRLIAQRTKRAVRKVAVPFTRLGRRAEYMGGGTVFRHGVATGLHGANGNVMVQWPGKRPGEKPVGEQLTGSTRGPYFKRLTDEQIETYARLSDALDKATKNHREFLSLYGVDLKDAVTGALDDLKDDDPKGNDQGA